MPAFRVSGSTGQAPTTRWFGCLLPDKVNMAVPAHWDPSFNNSIIIDQVVAANFGNQWTPYNTSYTGGANLQTITLGGFTTAPDGTTNTAQAWIEDNSGSSHEHHVSAGLGNYVGSSRFAAILKDKGRRVILAVTIGGSFSGAPGGLGGAGVKAIFDLAGGQIGQPATAFGGTIPGAVAALGSAMYPLGDGWYLCIVDGQINRPPGWNVTNDYRFAMTLDNGTGTAAESSSYTGDGTSGVYVWRTNALPRMAWGMNNEIMYDDFNYSTPGQIAAAFDLANTRQPGFKWYLSNRPGQNVTDPATISVSGSVMTLADNGARSITQLQSNTYNGDLFSYPPGWSGYGSTLPFLWESKLSIAFPSAGGTGGSPNGVSFWTSTAENIAANNYAVTPSITGRDTGREIDVIEYLNNVPPSRSTASLDPSGGTAPFNLGQTATFAGGIVPWLPGVGYDAGQQVSRLGVFYAAVDHNVGSTPPSAHWTAYSSTIIPVPIVFDPSQMNVWGLLAIPYNPATGEHGEVMIFLNGMLTTAVAHYEQGQGSLSDGGHQPIQFIVAQGAGADNSMSVDYIKVTQ